MVTQAEYIILDLKNQLSRLCEERAIYFAIASEREQEIKLMKQELNDLKTQSSKN